MIQTNSLKAWILASRPKTLTAAIAPVIIALALAYDNMHTLHFMPAALCTLFAMVMQIDANFVNDYFDFRRGNDDAQTRLGPLRACSMGWVTPRAMITAIIITTAVAAIIGLPLIFIGGWEMILIGIACIAFCFLYTTTLSYIGMGDVLVLIFFGFVPVCLTYYLQTGEYSLWSALLAAACGMVIDNLLIINNYRDIDNDRSQGKRTLIVMIGRNAALWLYLILGLAATAIVGAYVSFDLRALIMLPYLILHRSAYIHMAHHEGRELNSVLGETARNNLIFGLLTAVTIMC